MTESRDSLTRLLTTFLKDAVTAAEQRHASGEVQPRADGPAFADLLAGLPAAAEADSAALRAAEADSYLLRDPARQVKLRPAGRALSARALAETGVAGLLLSGHSVDVPVLARELAGYLAGPPVPLWDYAIIDAGLNLSEPVPVVEGWELATPSSDELAGLVGVPSAARYVTRASFDLDLYGGLGMLRRIDPDGKARDGITVFFNRRPAHGLWLPLLALSLYQNPVLHLWAQYIVEPGRRVDVLFDHVYTEPWTPDGVTEVEVVRCGDYEVPAADEPRFRQFLSLLAPLLDAAARPGKPKQMARLRRIAEHFLTAGEDAYGEGEVLSELNAESVLHYVIALEALLTGEESDKTELTRKVFQRAAVLAGADGPGRLKVAKIVKDAYSARSAYAHGSREPADIDLPALRQVVRDCVSARLILGDPVSGGPSLAELADSALLDHVVLADRVRGPIKAFWGAVGSD